MTHEQTTAVLGVLDAAAKLVDRVIDNPKVSFEELAACKALQEACSTLIAASYPTPDLTLVP